MMGLALLRSQQGLEASSSEWIVLRCLIYVMVEEVVLKIPTDFWPGNSASEKPTRADQINDFYDISNEAFIRPKAWMQPKNSSLLRCCHQASAVLDVAVALLGGYMQRQGSVHKTMSYTHQHPAKANLIHHH